MKNQFMPMFWGDFFANTLHLSAQEVGAYVLLIAHAWEHSAEIETAHAQRIARVSNRHWQRVRAKLAPFFEPPDGLQGSASKVVHTRCCIELTRAAEISSKRKVAAEQMHANKRASASHLPFYLPAKESSNGKEGETPSVQMQAPTPAWHPKVDDGGDGARYPPRAKSDNPLTPIPEKKGGQ